MVELLMPVDRVTKTTRAASPPLATRTLFNPAPAIVARIANESDGEPAGLRNSHQRMPLKIIERKLTPSAAASSGSDAFLIECHADPQSMVRAKMMRNTRMTPVSSQELLQKAVRKLEDEIKRQGGPNAAGLELPEVHIRGDMEVRYESVGRVVVACLWAGISKVGFITEPPPNF